MVRLGVMVIVIACAGSARAQSINVNFGDPSGAPSSDYAAAGMKGVWNSISGVEGTTFTFVGLNGSPTAITMTQSPTTTLLGGSSDPSVSGDDAKLLDSGLVTTGAETCLAFTGFESGSYEVLVYAWTPNQPGVKSRTRQDDAPDTIDVGGAWTGAHAEGVTYARYVVNVVSGGLPAHSGLAPGQPSAALNGVQIRLMGPATGTDAGVGDGGGSNEETGDAGTDQPDHHGGCSAGGGAGLGLALVALMPLRRRR